MGRDKSLPLSRFDRRLVMEKKEWFWFSVIWAFVATFLFVILICSGFWVVLLEQQFTPTIIGIAGFLGILVWMCVLLVHVTQYYFMGKTDFNIFASNSVGASKSKLSKEKRVALHPPVPAKYLSKAPEGLILGISSSEPTYSSVFAVNRHTEEVLGKTHIDSYFSDGLLPIKKGTKWGCINNNGEIAIPFQFDVIECFNNGVAIAKKDGKYGLIDTSGKELTGFIYDKLEGFTGEFKDYFKATINNKKGLINAVGETIVEFEFDDFIPYVFDDMMRSQNDGMMRVHKDGKEGLIDKDGNFVLECKYTAIRFISNELLVLSESQKVGVFDKHLNEIVPCEYDFIAHTCAKDGFVVALKDGLWGFLDISGNTFVPYKNTNNYYYERSLRIAAYGFENALNVLEDDFWNDFPAKFNTLEDVDSLIDLINAMIFKRMRESKKEGQKIEELYAKVMSNAIAKRIEIINNQFGIKKNPLVRAQQDFENLVKPTGSLVDPK